jgi:Arc/MetJ family transcription regulator
VLAARWAPAYAGVTNGLIIGILFTTVSAGLTSKMRTNIEIDDELMQEALRVSGFETKRAVVEGGLRALIRLTRQKKLLDLAGKVHWEGDLDQSREGRVPP